MSLWGMTDSNTSAPKFAVAGGLGVAANGNVLFQNVTVGVFSSKQTLGVFGVDTNEKSNTSFEGPKATHSGWVQCQVGTGYVSRIDVVSGGAGYTPSTSGFIVFGAQGSGVGANATFFVNATGNVANVVINNVGNTYNTTTVTANAAAAYTVAATLSVVMGGRAGRKSYITLVAAGSMSRDANTDDAVFGG